MTYRVRCTGYNAHEKNFTIGKVYEVKDNCITADDGFVYHGNNHDNGTIVEWLARWYAFETVVEDEVTFKVGDRVRLKPGLIVGEVYANLTFNPAMQFDDTATVIKVDTDNTLMIDRTKFWYSFEMIVHDDKPAPKVIISNVVNPPTLTAKERVMCAIASSGYPYAVKSDSGLLFYSDLPNGVSVFKTSDVKGW